MASRATYGILAACAVACSASVLALVVAIQAKKSAPLAPKMIARRPAPIVPIPVAAPAPADHKADVPAPGDAPKVAANPNRPIVEPIQPEPRAVVVAPAPPKPPVDEPRPEPAKPPESPAAPDDLAASVVRQLAAQLADRDPKKRLAAAKELQQLGPKARDAARPLCQACMDPAGRVSVAAIEAIEAIRPDLHAHIITIVRDNDGGRRDRAFDLLARLGEDAAPVTPIAVAYLRRAAADDRNSDCRAATRFLAVVASDDASLLAPLTELARNNPREEVGRDCVMILSKLAQVRPELRKKVFPTLLAYLSTPHVISGINGLARLGSDAKDALPQLRKLRFDSDARVREAAVAAIQSIERDTP